MVIVSIFIDADISCLVRGKVERISNIARSNIDVISDDVFLCGCIILTSRNASGKNYGAKTKEVLNIVKTECGLHGNLCGSEIISNIGGVKEINGLNRIVLKKNLEFAPTISEC